MTYTPIDKVIAHRVSQIFWNVLPDIYPGLRFDENDSRFKALWSAETEELQAVYDDDPLVDYPIIYLGIDVVAGIAPGPYLFPPNHGTKLRLSKYLAVLERFLILQLTGTEGRHVELIWYAVRDLAQKVSQEELLQFIDLLWRGRWICGARDWAEMRLSVITGGSDEGRIALQKDESRLTAEALRLIQEERRLKDKVSSLDEWLFSIYCFLPDVITWFYTIRRARESLNSDEFEKYDRVLDEFLADMMTTIQIPLMAAAGAKNFAEEYAIIPFLRAKSMDEAISSIHGIFRGRSIIPRVWFDFAKDALVRAHPDRSIMTISELELKPGPNGIFHEDDYKYLNCVDLASVFGLAFTQDGKDDNWLLLGNNFDYWEAGDEPDKNNG